jgi:hypothetical protein
LCAIKFKIAHFSIQGALEVIEELVEVDENGNSAEKF